MSFARHDRARAGLYRRLAAMEQAGIPLAQAVARVQAQGGAGARWLEPVSEALREGADPALAFAAIPGVEPLEVRLVEAGTRAGSLPDVFEQLARLFEERDQVRRQLVLELAYPVFLAHGAVFLPAIPTWFLHGLGAYLSETLGPLFAIYGVLCLAFLAWRSARAGAPGAVDGLLLRVPLIGPLAERRAAALALSVLRITYGNGISVLEGLEAAAAAAPNRAVGARFDQLRREVAAGTPLGDALVRLRLPLQVSETLATGADTGKLEPMLIKAEEQLLESARALRAALVAGAGLATFLTVAAVVAFKVIGFYSDLYGKLGRF